MKIFIGIVLGYLGGYFTACLMDIAHRADVSCEDSTSFTAED